MPYSSVAEIPPDVKKALPEGAQTIWYKAFNSAYEQYKDDGKAAAVAWTAVKNAGYQKNAEGNWIKACETCGTKIHYDDGTTETKEIIITESSLTNIKAQFAIDANTEALSGKIWETGEVNCAVGGVPTHLIIPKPTILETYGMLKNDVMKGIITIGIDHAGDERDIAHDLGEVDEVGITPDENAIYMKKGHFFDSEKRLKEMHASGVFFRDGYGYSIMADSRVHTAEDGKSAVLDFCRIKRVDVVKGAACKTCKVIPTNTCPPLTAQEGKSCGDAGLSKDKESVSMTPEEQKALDERLEKMGETLKAKNVEILALQARLTEREECAKKAQTRIADMEAKLSAMEANAELDALNSQGKIATPEMRNALLSARNSLPKEQWDTLKASLPTAVPQGEKGQQESKPTKVNAYDMLPPEVKAVAGIPQKQEGK